jgi:hypothetical protein
VTPLVAPVIVGRRELSPEAFADSVATPVKTAVAWWLAPFDTTVSPVKDAFGGSLAPLQGSTAPTTGPIGAGATADGVKGEVPDDVWRCNRSGQVEAAYVLATARFCGDGATGIEEAAAAVAENGNDGDGADGRRPVPPPWCRAPLCDDERMQHVIEVHVSP